MKYTHHKFNVGPTSTSTAYDEGWARTFGDKCKCGAVSGLRGGVGPAVCDVECEWQKYPPTRPYAGTK
jgi:hypothetical protein